MAINGVEWKGDSDVKDYIRALEAVIRDLQIKAKKGEKQNAL